MGFVVVCTLVFTYWLDAFRTVSFNLAGCDQLAFALIQKPDVMDHCWVVLYRQ